MTKSEAKEAEGIKEAKLPARDCILLPIIGLLTICIVFLVTESVARRMLPVSSTLLANCIVRDDSTTGARAIPNSVCWEKSPESVGEEYRFNSCGHRAGMECGPKQSGAFRIVTTGSSVVMGERVPIEDSFAALLPTELSRLTGRNVELYNEGMGWGFSASSLLRFDDVLNAQPDLILWPLTPSDIEGSTFTPFVADKIGYSRALTLREKGWLRVKAAFSSKSVLAGLTDAFSRTRSIVLIRHFMNESQSQYLKAYLMGPDADVGFLKTEPSEWWQVNLLQFERNAANMEVRANAAGIPFVAAYLPNRAQAAMISMGEWPDGYDPYKLNEQLRSIITRNGGVYLDILPGFRAIPNAEQYYLPMDGHPNAEGHRIIAGLLAKELTSGAVPALRAAPQNLAPAERK